MPDFTALTEFAAARRHNLTGPLQHAQVVALAEAWFPEIRFHEKERFHPVDLPALLTAPSQVFQGLPESAKNDFRISVQTATLENGQAIVELFDPPIVRIPSPGGSRVLGSGPAVVDALDDLELTRGGVYTHGHRLEASREFFGASTTVAGGTEPAAGDPRLPRHLPVVVRVEMRLLLETLKHELQLDDLPPALEARGFPIDGIWSGFTVEESFFAKGDEGGAGGGTGGGPGGGTAFPRSAQRKILAALIAAHEVGDTAGEIAALDDIPAGWKFVQRAWNAVRQFAFLEYYLVYAFNDYKEYGTWPFENEHEGDVEGCCVVFPRFALEQFAAGGVAAADVVPHTVITSVHEEFNDSDCLKRLPVTRDRARDDLLVYVAAGSHATYLTPGSHDILDFEDVVTDLPGELPTWVIVLGSITLVLPVIALIAGIVEHFVDSEDQTSDNGASVGPGPADPASLTFEKRLEVTPLSDFQTGRNIYQDAPDLRAALAVRGFPGKWGGDDGTVDKSPPWENKTARFFRRFLEGGQIDAPIL